MFVDIVLNLDERAQQACNKIGTQPLGFGSVLRMCRPLIPFRPRSSNRIDCGKREGTGAGFVIATKGSPRPQRLDEVYGKGTIDRDS